MRVTLENPLGISEIRPRTVEAADLFLGEPPTADGHSDILVKFLSGMSQKFTADSYKIAKKDGKFYPCVIPFPSSHPKRQTRRSATRRTKSALATLRRRKF